MSDDEYHTNLTSGAGAIGTINTEMQPMQTRPYSYALI